MDKIEKLLAAANDRLKTSNAGIKIFRRGKKLSLRGMLPPKPNSKQNKSSQQIISLGVFCNAAGIRKEEKLSDRVLLELVFSTQPDTRQRKRAVMVASALAKFAGIDIDFKPYQGNYNFAKTVQRDLPTDEQIDSWYKQITNPAWQYAFGLMATYGLRGL